MPVLGPPRRGTGPDTPKDSGPRPNSSVAGNAVSQFDVNVARTPSKIAPQTVANLNDDQNLIYPGIADQFNAAAVR